MLSDSLGAGPGAGAAAARLPDLGEIGAALLGFAAPLHGGMGGAELLDLHRDVAEPAVDLHQAGRQVTLPVPAGRLLNSGQPLWIRGEIWCLRPRSGRIVAVLVLLVVLVDAKQLEHRPRQIVDVRRWILGGHRHTWVG